MTTILRTVEAAPSPVVEVSHSGAALGQIYSLAERARLASKNHQSLEMHLSSEESASLADVLDAALQLIAAASGVKGLSLGEPGSAELNYLAIHGGGFDWLADEPDLYTDADLRDRFEWTAASNGEQ